MFWFLKPCIPLMDQHSTGRCKIIIHSMLDVWVNVMPSLFSFTCQPFQLFSSSGDHRFVREEPFSHSLQELHVNLCAKGQPWGQLHDHHDSHNGCWQEEPGCKDWHPSLSVSACLPDLCVRYMSDLSNQTYYTVLFLRSPSLHVALLNV